MRAFGTFPSSSTAIATCPQSTPNLSHRRPVTVTLQQGARCVDHGEVASLRRIVDHPSTRVVLLILAGAQAMIGAFILGLAVNIGTSSGSQDGRPPATTTDAPVDKGPFPLVAASVAGVGRSPQSIAVTAGGELWFTINQPPAIGRVDAGGRMTSYRTRSRSISRAW